MAARLGQVLYWLGCGLAVVFAMLAGLGFYNRADPFGPIFFGVVPAIGSYLTGRACLFILAGR